MLPLPGELHFTVRTLSTLQRKRPRPWHRLRLCPPDWFKLNSDWAAEKSREKLFCPLFHSSLYAQRTLSTTAQSTDSTGQGHTARGAHNHPFWRQHGLAPVWTASPANKASHRGHTLAGWKQVEAGYLLLNLWQGTPDSAPAPHQFFILQPFVFQILNVSPSPPQVNLTAKSLHHFHASTLSVCICNNSSLAENLIKKQLQDISHYHKQISFKESNMLIHSTVDNSKEIQMRDYPLASFPPWEVLKKPDLKTFQCKMIVCTIVWRQLLGKIGLLSAGL